jgi:isoquinoline 1-oxidoreductase subunit beta
MVDVIAAPERRAFLKLGAAAGGGLLLSLSGLPTRDAFATVVGPAAAAPANAATLGAFIKVGLDGLVTFMMTQSEMGQGAHTGLTMIVAEELEAPFERVRFEQAPITAAYFNPRYVGANGGQGTGGSSSISQVAPPLRTACAAVREVLVAAGAAALGVPASECAAQAGHVVHANSGKRVAYGAVADAAARLPLPDKPVVKSPKEFKLLGRFAPRRDAQAKVTGQARFGIDVQMPGLLTAVVERCPVFGGKLASFDADAALREPGVLRVVAISSGVAVVARSFWQAKKGRELLKVQWATEPDPRWDSENLSGTLEQLGAQQGVVARNDGDVSAALANSSRRLEAVYESQYLDTAPLEPMNATAHVRADACELWVPTQFQSRALSAAQRITGLAPERISVNTTYLGGGFGRRFYHDFVEEAVEVSKAVGSPVKLVRSREDDMRHSYYRPASWNRIEAALDEQGRISAWRQKAVSSSILKILWPERLNAQTGLDGTATQGAANLLYDLPNYRTEWVRADSPVPVGIWRSVGDSQNAFVTQCFIDELAFAAKRDPVEFRIAHLQKTPQAQRLAAVLQLTAQKAGWGEPLPAGVHRGVAAVLCYGAFAAQVVEVSVSSQGSIKVHRVVAALDCGWVTSPDLVKQQAEGGVIYGLSAAMGEAITVKGGAVEQSNFHQYPIARLLDTPEIEFHLVPSEQPPLSVGEPAGTPCIAPAVANAVFAATGVRMRSMPFSRHNLRKG